MRKFTVVVEEQVVRYNTYEVEAESEDDVIRAMDDIDSCADHPDDVTYYLERQDCHVLNVIKGWEDCDYECNDYYENHEEGEE